jgi:transcriptional regulator with XRE-family HTH domain
MTMTDDFRLDPDAVDQERKRCGLTASEFAELAGIGRATWFRFLAEDGQQNRPTLRAIEQAYEKLKKRKRSVND